MFNVRKLLLVATLWALALGPALFSPALSAHAPTLTDPAAPASHGPASPSPALPVLLGTTTIKVKDPASIAAKWKTRATAAQADYGTGVQTAGNDWQTNSLAAEQNYVTSVTQAASAGRFGKGIAKAGAAKYVKNATTVGPQRYGTGVANGQDAMAAGMAPVVAALQAVQLPPRQPKGQNGGRSDAVVVALRKLKTA